MTRTRLGQLLPYASSDLLALLSPARGTPAPVVRGEVLGPERFAQHGHELGVSHHLLHPGAPADAHADADDAYATKVAPTLLPRLFFPRLRANIDVLREARAFIAHQAASGYEPSPASEWLLDNFHLIEAQLAEIRDGLPRSYFRTLPVLQSPPLAGLPRVYGIAWAYVAHTDGDFDERLLGQFLCAYQNTHVLQSSELWALPTTLRVVLVENLRRVAERLAIDKAAVEAANQCWDHLGEYDTERLDALLAMLDTRGVTAPFLAQLAQRALGRTVPGADNAAETGTAAQRAWLRAALPAIASARAQKPADQAADNLSVSNAVTSLRAIGDADWAAIIADCSPLMQLLLTSPLFAAEHPSTRDRTLHRIESLARRSQCSELDVARCLLARMHASSGPVAVDEAAEGVTPDPAASSAADYWLRGPGRSALADDLCLHGAGAQWRARERLRVAGARLLRTSALPLYLTAIAVGTACAAYAALAAGSGSTLASAPAWLVAVLALLAVLPASEAVVAMLNRMISESTRPARLPRLALADGIPGNERVLVVIPSMLTHGGGVAELLHQLEQHYLANPEQHAQFALLTDWRDADSAHVTGDDALLRQAMDGVRALSARHPRPAGADAPVAPRFVLLHRNRRFSHGEQRWIGWERKRGKIEQLVLALAGGENGFLDLGDASQLEQPVRHVLTLDSDTGLPPGRLRELVGVAAHPHNRPRLDASGRFVAHGYGILQSRVVMPLPTPADITPFHWLFAGQCGSDPYSVPSSEVYQDLFGEGTFTGKGLLHVATLHAVLGGRLPNDSVLSHDLLEGALARCATVSDVTLVEDAPAHPDVAAARAHRWTRGDWQLLPFLLPFMPLSTASGAPAGGAPARGALRLRTINRWKMFDNLRRSLVPPACLALLVCSLFGIGADLAPALLLVFAAFVAGPALGAIAGLAPSRDDIALQHFYRQAVTDLMRALLGGVWHVVQLLQHSLQACDAILRALWRMLVSRRHLLQWTTAAAVKAAARTEFRAMLWQHALEPLLAIALAAALLAASQPGELPWWPWLLCATWGASPVWSWLASRPRKPDTGAALDAADRATLESHARATWRLFERTVCAEDHHLPPDNLQTAPHAIVAHRTSPTNIGLYLLSLACARQFGWVGTSELAERMEATLASLAHLERHRGHFLNWYDTQTRAPLLPRYVSAVDSGNLCGHLLAVAQACRALAQAPFEPGAAYAAVTASQRRLAPLKVRAHALSAGNANAALAELLALPNPLLFGVRNREGFADLLQRATLEWQDHARRVDDAPGADVDPFAAPQDDMEAELAGQLGDHLATLASAMRDTHAEHAYAIAWPAHSAAAPGSAPPAHATVDAGAQTPPAPSPAAVAMAARLHALAAAFEALAWAPEFGFLYHPTRHLLHIGYRVAERELDAGFFDLLASEARLTSLLAIAKGDVPVRHWAALGRPFHAVGTCTALRSWSGSMFEYLMPTLVLDEPEGSALHAACVAAVHEQVAFANAEQLPWGISESAYAGRDHTLAYQYAPQGVPRLALRRTPADERVIAPYATMLALQVAPRRALLNLERLRQLGARRRFGFIEELDYSPSRQITGSTYTPVDTFMAHHQGMSIVACANVLLDGVAREWAMSNAALEAVSSLLHERPPREVSNLRAVLPASLRTAQAVPGRTPGLPRDLRPGSTAIAPTQLLSNGRYHLTLRDNGAGGSRWNDTDITRDRDDVLRDGHGNFLYLRWSPDTTPTSITQHPAPDELAVYRAVFHADRVCFDAAWPHARAHTTVWVSPEDDIEFRQVELTNHGDHVLAIELMSAFEPTLARAAADEAHPAFSNLFLRTAWRASQQALLLERKPRLPGEPGMHAAHFLAATDGELLDVRIQTQRSRWRGRNRTVDVPLAQFDDVPQAPACEDGAHAADALQGAPDVDVPLVTGLDPVCALAVQLRIAPGATITVTFATTAGDDPDTLRAVIDKYRQRSHVRRASLMSATLAGIRLRTLQLGTESFAAVQTLTTALVCSLGDASAGETTAAATGTNAGAAGAPEAPTIAPAVTPHTMNGSDGDARCDRRLLWRFGISGERPIVLVFAGVPRGLGLLRTLAQALRLWSWGGVACDLVVVNAEPSSYLMTIQRELGLLRERHAEEVPGGIGTRRAGFHVLADDTLSPDERETLLCHARVAFNADGRPLAHHVAEWEARHQRLLTLRRPHIAARFATLTARHDDGDDAAHAFAGGAFDAASGIYRFDVQGHRRPARPWANVLANPDFGTLVTETGGGFTWAANSRLNRLTSLSNDPLVDPGGEWFALQDRRTHALWMLTSNAHGHPTARYRVEHGQGSTTISHRAGDIDVRVSWCVDSERCIKQVSVVLTNIGTSTAYLRLVGVVEWLLGGSAVDRMSTRTARMLLPRTAIGDRGPRTGATRAHCTALTCTQREHGAGFGDGTAFFAVFRGQDHAPGNTDTNARSASAIDTDDTDWTCDRRECIDQAGHAILPPRFDSRSGDGLDPCAALSLRVSLDAGASTERVFLLGHAGTPDAAAALLQAAGSVTAAERAEATRAHWDRLLSATTVRTPDALFDVLVNRWLLYQAMSSRLWARAGFYQAGGAIGFRDQLQDSLALTWAAPALTRQQIVLAASRQFAEGDVQHWWHPTTGAGVRTHFADDLLWLPYACAHYVTSTGDHALLEQSVPFLEGVPVPAGVEDAYYAPGVSTQYASVYEHAARAIDRSLRVGSHGLPLIGGGDWNDGMNRVGAEGRGESVWLAFFLRAIVDRFLPFADARGDHDRVARWRAADDGWRDALAGPAWDGTWYRRAFFDDGSALGSAANAEARIDLIAQAWAVLTNSGTQARQRSALDALDRELVDPEAGLLHLLTPPFVAALPNAGYIQAYPPGVRENGGQYSHAAVWALMAQAAFARDHGDVAASTGNPVHAPGDLAAPQGVAAHAVAGAAGDAAYRYFTYVSPSHRAAHPGRGPVYALEPYAVAGDVYGAEPYVGRGGWSWYTGAAAWLHRAAVESMFGLTIAADTLSFVPCLPVAWKRAELLLERDGMRMRFILLRTDAVSALAIAARWQPVLLHPGQSLHWRALPRDSCHVIPLAPG